jgi:outer membrane protein TolC
MLPALMLLLLCEAHAQSRSMTLDEVILLAKNQSPRYKLAQTQKEISYYRFLTYKSDFNPQVSFIGNAPVYNKEYFGVRQPDGTIKFQSIQQNIASAGFALSQQIPLTGGELSLNTDVTRFDDFKSKTKQYNGTPVYIKLAQPLSSFNELKWRKKIEPLKYDESRREFVQEMESIAQQAVSLYFDVLDAQNNISIASANLRNTENNYEIEKKRINLGTTTEDRLLQLELQVLNSRQNLEKARYDQKIAQLNLKTFAGTRDTATLAAIAPQQIPLVAVDIDKAIGFARQYRPEFIAFERKKYEARRDVEQAKALRQQVVLLASFGLNNVGTEIESIYKSPNDQQRFSVGFNIPIVDWGRRKARYNTARALEKLNDFNSDLQEAVIVQEITTLVQSLVLLKSSIAISQTTDSVAQRRYTIANNLYQLGKLTITELNLAQAEKDNARRTYMTALRAYWTAYYMLRRLTLYDFDQQQELYRE